VLVFKHPFWLVVPLFWTQTDLTNDYWLNFFSGNNRRLSGGEKCEYSLGWVRKSELVRDVVLYGLLTVIQEVFE
jgi:membrane protease YdiL (CAAX protease family)